ncbi:MAG TPA: PilN domain-containing protein [Solirubrobacteraceae bacterium]|jgi:Tfp pilus assembly protein PilN
MKAVNLIPVEDRRGLRGGGSGSGVASYIVLGVLAAVVVMSAAYTLTNRSLSDRHAQLESVQSQVENAQAQVQRYSSYTGFTALRQKRTETVRSLAASRFDWSHALHELARTIPSNAWLTSLKGTVTPGISIDGGGTDPLRGSLPNPALEVVGCTTSQADVAKVISSLRRVDGVERLSLSSSQKLDQGASGGSTGDSGGGGDCRYGNAHYPQFSMTLFFATPTTPSGAHAASATTTP